jgi:hypothetical protein
MASVFDPLITLARERFAQGDLDYILDAINKGDSDTHAAILGGTFVEGTLKDAILSHLVVLSEPQQADLFRSSGPLSTFDSMIIMGRALGLYDSKAKHDLTAIRHVRNAFAHGRKVRRFDQKEVADVCNSFHSLGLAKTVGEDPQTPREKFSLAVRILATRFLKYSAEPERPQTKSDTWAQIIAWAEKRPWRDK